MSPPAALDPSLVLFEDHHLLIVNKPAPLLTQAPPGVPSLEAMAKAYIKAKYAKPAGVYLAVPHRLDRPVSGVICFVRNTKAAQRVHEQFHNRTVEKTYWAAVVGDVAPPAGQWEDWIRKAPDEARAVRASPDEPGAKQATVDYTVLGPIPGGTLLELRPHTGRMHQLRVQTAWRRHPVLGDSAYAPAPPFGHPAELPREHVIALHARRLALDHPFTKQRLTVEAPLPAYWRPLGLS